MNGHRTITRLAGKLTPDDKVDVAINTRIMPSLKAPKLSKKYIYYNESDIKK